MGSFLPKMLMVGMLMACAEVQAHGINNPEMFDSVLHYQTGKVQLSHHLQVDTGSSLRFLNAQDANHVIYDVWGGSPDPTVLGMLVPAGISPVSDGGWGLTLHHLPIGYVDTRTGTRLDREALLSVLQDTPDSPVQVLNFALAPEFNREQATLSWATTVKIPNAEAPAVFPKLVLLGREGALLMKGVVEQQHWPALQPYLPDLSKAVQFQPGHAYRDVQAGDVLYEYGLASLVAERPMADPVSSRPVAQWWLAGFLAMVGVLALALRKTRWGAPGQRKVQSES